MNGRRPSQKWAAADELRWLMSFGLYRIWRAGHRAGKKSTHRLMALPCTPCTTAHKGKHKEMR